MLRTKAMREREAARDLRRYKFCIIRVKFPDNIILQVRINLKFCCVVIFFYQNLIFVVTIGYFQNLGKVV